MSLADRGWAHAEQTRILRKFNKLMTGFDVIVLPTSPVSPFPWTQSHAHEIDGQDMDIYYRWLALCYRGSLSGRAFDYAALWTRCRWHALWSSDVGAVRGDDGLLAAAKALELLFKPLRRNSPPLADMDTLPPRRWICVYRDASPRSCSRNGFQCAPRASRRCDYVVDSHNLYSCS